MCCAFFFSSRRRHTRFSRDWSSDVCSSDLDDGLCAAFLDLGHEVPAHLVSPHPLERMGWGPVAAQADLHEVEIGRASCRERESITAIAVSLYNTQIGMSCVYCAGILDTSDQ